MALTEQQYNDMAVAMRHILWRRNDAMVLCAVLHTSDDREVEIQFEWDGMHTVQVQGEEPFEGNYDAIIEHIGHLTFVPVPIGVRE